MGRSLRGQDGRLSTGNMVRMTFSLCKIQTNRSCWQIRIISTDVSRHSRTWGGSPALDRPAQRRCDRTAQQIRSKIPASAHSR